VVGAGQGRTGTESLKQGLEILLGGPCYHMFEVMKNPEHVPAWHRAALGEPIDWERMFDGYVAGVDWPVAAYWRELMDVYPDAIILLSSRDPEKWWKSASETIFPSIMRNDEDGLTRRLMIRQMMASRFTADLTDKDACIAAFNANNEAVRRTVPPERLVDWTPGDGWEPICKGLKLPVPEQPFPHVNSKDAFIEKMGLDKPVA
jgi:hypothetical protein